jgi:phage protein D
LPVQNSASAVRKPRGKVTANGTPLRFSKFEVIQNNNHGTDTFQVELPLFDPKAPFDWKWWSDQTDIEIEVAVGFEQADGSTGSWQSLIVGPVDAIAMAPLSYGHNQGGGSSHSSNTRAAVGYGGVIQHEGGPAHPEGSVLTIRGRDYSGQLQDSQMSQQFTGNDLSAAQLIPQIVSRIPQLSVDVEEADDSIATVYNGQGGRLFLNRSPWDVITSLADHEGYQVRMKGRTVVVKPNGPPDTSNPYRVFYTPEFRDPGNPDNYRPVQSNVITLRMSRALNIAKGVDVFVQAYDTATGQRPSRKVAKVRSSRRASRHAGNQAQSPTTYTFNRPGMSPAQAQRHAKARASQVAQFERNIEFQIAGDPTMSIGRAITLSGTGTAFDQTYFADQIDHRLSVEGGYAMEIRAKNQSPDTTTTDGDATSLEAAEPAAS